MSEGMPCPKSEKDKKETLAYNQLCILFTLYDLNVEFKDRFIIKLNFYCEKFKTNIDSFLKYRE